MLIQLYNKRCEEESVCPRRAASRPHHVLVVVAEHPREELILVRAAVLLRGRTVVTGLFWDGQLAVVGDAKFDSWDRVEVVLVRGTDLVDVLPLSVTPTVRRVIDERWIEAIGVDLGNEAESAVEGLCVREAVERREGGVLWRCGRHGVEGGDGRDKAVW